MVTHITITMNLNGYLGTSLLEYIVCYYLFVMMSYKSFRDQYPCVYKSHTLTSINCLFHLFNLTGYGP